jgi:hypothetical protein
VVTLSGSFQYEGHGERRRLAIEQDKVMMSVDEFDRLFDEGEVDVLQYMDMSTLHYPGREARTVAVDLPSSPHAPRVLPRT